MDGRQGECGRLEHSENLPNILTLFVFSLLELLLHMSKAEFIDRPYPPLSRVTGMGTTLRLSCKHLVSHTCALPCCLQVVGGSARSAATQLLHKVVQRQVLADWRLAVHADRALKLEVVRAWSAWVQEHQVWG